MRGAYGQLLDLAVPTRRAAALLGLSRTSIYRKPAVPEYCEPVEPPNKLSAAERAEILAALNSPDFVDLAPLQVYTKLLDAGIYLGSVSTFYRVLRENEQVKERRALAKHPARAIPELVATAPGHVYSCYAEVLVCRYWRLNPEFLRRSGLFYRHNHRIMIDLVPILSRVKETASWCMSVVRWKRTSRGSNLS